MKESLALKLTHQKWGIWEEELSELDSAASRLPVIARLCIAGCEVLGRFETREEAAAFQAEMLHARLQWPRIPFLEAPCRDPLWDHPAELEPCKEYSFHEARGGRILTSGGPAFTEHQLQEFNRDGFLVGLSILDAEELDIARRDFDELLATRIHCAPSDEARFRSAHTLSRPLHQDLVARLAQHPRVLAIVEDLLGPRFVCWSAHLFCKLPGDPTTQPWHQDAGFWPLTQSRALTLWLAFDDVDENNAAVTFVQGSHRLGRLPWQRTSAKHHLLTQEIPDVDLLGKLVVAELRGGEASVHCDLTIHGSPGNNSSRRRAGLALRYVGTDAECLGPMLNGYRMNGGCILPKGSASDPKGHWRHLRRRAGGNRAPRVVMRGLQVSAEA